jgi:hypothetical protein
MFDLPPTRLPQTRRPMQMVGALRAGAVGLLNSFSEDAKVSRRMMQP